MCLSLRPAACSDGSELLRAPSGVITSPGWPFQYPSRLNCSWNIRARPGDTVTIRYLSPSDLLLSSSPLPPSDLSLSTCSFQDFDLQGSHRCSSDWMSVSSYRSLEGLRVCGSSLPPPFTSSQDHVWIHFHSDDSLTGKGFRLSYISGQHLDPFHCREP